MSLFEKNFFVIVYTYDYQIEIELKSDYIHRVNLKMLTDDLERKVSKLESSTESKYKRGLTKLSVQ